MKGHQASDEVVLLKNKFHLGRVLPFCCCGDWKANSNFINTASTNGFAF